MEIRVFANVYLMYNMSTCSLRVGSYTYILFTE
jgi:hypothetical protein